LRQGRELSELLPRGTWTREVSERIAEHVKRDAVRLGRPRKYTLDEMYFDEITDEHRAYWLGFITADGGITEIAPARPGVLRVELAEYVRALYENAPDVLERKRLLAEQLCAIDFGQMKAQANEKRAATMRDAWATGRHSRAKSA
jgi:hypothetical protein